ncbi:hypothetical protein TESG_03531 [Trichophyton tonsurans CBS 112818]|uniref:Uncharacterized protein n=1 Tax=Trichophyton tonsurans (strain CBS 112818) TaxID=647933 RepID=F2RXM2_TRIT1|nr:hypothetical protein TESG_03531 [Trichophyton tonsurans CBS 112818]
MAYTQMYTCGPSHVLPTIGSLADSLNRTEDNPFFDFFCSTPEAESIRATFGEVTYQQYVEQALVSQQRRYNDRTVQKFDTTVITLYAFFKLYG